jgi:hypothetical protein
MRSSNVLMIRAATRGRAAPFPPPENHFPTRLKSASSSSMDTHTPRHDGWTIDRQMIFLTRLAVTRSVSKAAAAAGMSRQGAYGFRWSTGGAEFDRAWTHILRLPRAARTNAARTPAAQTLSASTSRPAPSAPSQRVTKLTPQIAARRPSAPDVRGETGENISLSKARHNVQTVQSCRDGAALSAAPPAPAPRRAPAGSAIDRPGGTARGHR